VITVEVDVYYYVLTVPSAGHRFSPVLVHVNTLILLIKRLNCVV